MQRNFIYLSDTLDPYVNISTDEWFLDHISDDDLILYFYQNAPSVIIGKNQNPWRECDLHQMECDGVKLVRRVSGGGAVFHDEGNLNFSFISGKNRSDDKRASRILMEALERLGIEAELSGRNDILWRGRKFSGNAKAVRHGRCMQHGTLLVSAALERLALYLTVDPSKIRSKGIASVRSRVCNLTEAKKELDMEILRGSVTRSFENEVGYWGEWQFSSSEAEERAAYTKRHSDPEWFLGQTPKFDYEFRKRYSFGGVELLISLEKGKITAVSAFSDALNTELSSRLENTLVGIRFDDAAIRRALSESGEEELMEMSREAIIE